MSRKQILRKLRISLMSLALFLVVGEFVARALEPGPFSFFDSNPYVAAESRADVKRHAPQFRGRWDGTWYETNSLGLRGPEVPGDTEDDFRVVCLGDSATFGKGVVESATWPRQLERKLEADGAGRLRPVVANLGVNGYSGGTYELMWRDIGRDLAPDVVLIGFHLNDFPNAIQAVNDRVFRERGLRRLLRPSLLDPLNRFALYRLARQSFYHFRRESDWKEAESFARGAGELIDEAAWEKQRRHLTAIRDDVQARGSHLAVFLLPYESLVYLDSFDRSAIHRLADLCVDLGLPFVDMSEEFRKVARETDPPRELFLLGDRYHPRAEGYEVVADCMLRLFREQNWLGGP